MKHPISGVSMQLLAIGAVFGTGALLISGGGCAQAQEEKKNRTAPAGYDDTPFLPDQKWRVHDIKRPHPRVVTPAADDCRHQAPSDAIVLFDGKDLSKWYARGRGANRGKMIEPRWKVQDGYMEIAGGTGDLISKEKFGNAQFHIEWAAPAEIDGTSQWRGNSGVVIMGNYEIQVLDSYDNPTYADGQAASLYGQWPPLVNASRKPGEWQTFDIVFEAPVFEGDKLAKPAYATVFHNGVLMHHRQQFIGRMAHRIVRPYAPHGAEEPLVLQDHDTKVRYRNIWVRKLTGYDQP
ncbi:MAG TPA: DUF1080 domain-containing protein [Bryobacteraceae bacterium]|nr:DUF1080 domain-containing protein [Bryobacteraceae bacterium]